MKLKPQIRALRIEQRAMDDENRTIELSFSSDTPYERWWGVETLDHNPKSVRMERINGGSPLLMDHNPRDQIGVIEKAWIEGNKGKATVRFGKSDRATEIWNDVKDGIRSLISVGYRIHEMVLEEQREDGPDAYRVTDWEPMEISIVAVPADMNVGIGREADGTENEVKITETERSITMPEKEPVTAPQVDAAEAARKAANDRAREVNEIFALGDRFNMREEAAAHVRDGKSLDDFRAQVINQMETKKTIDTQQADIGLGEKDVRDYSLMRAIQAAITGDWSRAGLEREVSQETEKRFGKRNPKSFMIPNEVLARALTTGSGGTGLVGTDHLGGNFIEALRARSVIFRLGALSLTGLKGDVSIPKQSGVSTVEIVAEGGTGTYGDPSFTNLSMTPYDLRGRVAYTRQLLLQSDPSVEALIMNDLAREFALAIDNYAINGSGSAQPTGILNTSGIGSVVGTSLGWSGVVELETDVLAANGDIGAMNYLTTPSVNGTLKTREKASNTAKFISEGNEINGYPVATSTKVPSATMLFGAFNSLIVAFWGAMELTVDPYSDMDNGRYVIRAFQEFDSAVRQAGAFSAATSIT